MKKISITRALKEDHERIRELMEKAINSKEHFIILKKHLQVHHEAEENILLHVLNHDKEVKDESLESQEEHYVINALLLDLADFPYENERWKVKYKVLAEYLNHHLNEEEEDLFPGAEKQLDEKHLMEMGSKFNEILDKQLPVLEKYAF